MDMDISAVGGAQMAPEIQAQYAVKLIKMAQESQKVIGSILTDTADISQEAMSKFLSEAK